MLLPLGGCGAFGGAVALGALQGTLIGAGLPSPTSPPKIFCMADDSMTIRYGYTGSKSFDVHNEVMRHISEHCEGGYVETHREEYLKWRKIYVACLQADGSPPQSPSCKYVPPEVGPVGFGNYDPATGK